VERDDRHPFLGAHLALLVVTEERDEVDVERLSGGAVPYLVDELAQPLRRGEADTDGVDAADIGKRGRYGLAVMLMRATGSVACRSAIMAGGKCPPSPL
jgi:hypothetical protein